MEQAIKLAIKGGWKPECVDFTDMDVDRRGVLFYEDFPENKRDDIEKDFVYFYDTEYPEEGYYAGMLMKLALFDPLFWQALGKALGWNYVGPLYTAKEPWQEEWHRFIDHLANGKSPDSFFEELLAPNSK